MGGATLSAKGGGAAVYRFGASPGWAVGRICGWAKFGPAAFYSPFFVSFFLFSISLITFAKRHQINSNQFLNFSKNQHNVLKQ
jgi:hypothetical protein